MNGCAAAWPTRVSSGLSPAGRLPIPAAAALPAKGGGPAFCDKRSRSFSSSCLPRNSFDTAKPTAATAPAMQIMSSVCWSILHLHRRDLLDREKSHDLQCACDAEHHSAVAGLHQDFGVLGVQRVGDHEHDQREGDHDVAGEAPFGSLGLYLLLQAHALADRVADILQHFAQVAAGLTVD